MNLSLPFLKGEGKVVIAKIDASTHTVAAGTYGVKGFPTLKLFSNGVAKDYEGERTSLAMIQWIKKDWTRFQTYFYSRRKRSLFPTPLLE